MMHKLDRRKLEDLVEDYNKVLTDNLPLDAQKIKIQDIYDARAAISTLGRRLNEVHYELTLQYQILVESMGAGEIGERPLDN